MDIIYSNIGRWCKARKDGKKCSWCWKPIAKSDRYWKDDYNDGGPTCFECATKPGIDKRGKLRAMADPNYTVDQLIDYLGDGSIMVTPTQAYELDRGIGGFG